VSAGIGSVKDLATDRVVIDSVAVSVDRDDDSPDSDFLNSFYLDELAMVSQLVASGDVGAALGAYLAGDQTLQLDSRIDVVRNPDVVDAGTEIERLPPGRWPANPSHSLALSQQFAVNEAMTTLGPASGLIGVNGPPGTGKTTMLRDILAANVVERARRLAVLEHTDDAFTDATHRWIAHNGYPRVMRQLSPELTGFEMVIASANNAAVENVTSEIPASTAIHESWRGRADYFAAMATEVMRAAAKRDPARASVSAEAWGLVAARLGNRRNRSEFYSAFWFDEKDPTPNARAGNRTPRMQAQLKRWRDGTEPYKPWAQAREDFAEAWRTVDVLIEQRRRARDRRRRLAELDEHERALDASWCEIRGRIRRIDERLADHTRNEYELEVERTRSAAERDRQQALRPGVSETLRSHGRAWIDWRTELRPLSRRLRETDGRLRDAMAAGQEIRETLEQAHADQSAVADNLAVIRRDLTELRDECQRDELRYGDGYPDDAWTGERRELHAPWLDPELDTARSELFLAALQLHQDFLANAADEMLPCLRAAVEVVAGRYPALLSFPWVGDRVRAGVAPRPVAVKQRVDGLVAGRGSFRF
jgi:hypothetical protein